MVLRGGRVPNLLARGAGAPSKSRVALGKHPFLSKGPTFGVSPCASAFPHGAPGRRPREASSCSTGCAPPPVSGCGQLTWRGQNLGSRWCGDPRPLPRFSLSMVWGLHVARGLLLCPLSEAEVLSPLGVPGAHSVPGAASRWLLGLQGPGVSLTPEGLLAELLHLWGLL